MKSVRQKRNRGRAIFRFIGGGAGNFISKSVGALKGQNKTEGVKEG